MSFVIFPLADSDSFDYNKSFGDTKYWLFYRWIEQGKGWHCSIRDFTDTTIQVLKIRLVFGRNMFQQTQYAIPGTLILVEGTQSNHDAPSRDAFQKDSPNSTELRYYTEFYSSPSLVPDL